jgi:hypothetical protein
MRRLLLSTWPAAARCGLHQHVREQMTCSVRVGLTHRAADADEGALPHLVESRGAEGVQRVYLDTLKGRIPPEQGHMLSLLG